MVNNNNALAGAGAGTLLYTSATGFTINANNASHDINTSGDKYIYESPDGGETIFRRKFNDDNSSKEKIDKDGNPYPEQLNFFVQNTKS